MSKVQKSLRIEGDIAESIDALKTADETEAAVFNRVLRAGLDALEGGTEAGEAGQLAGDQAALIAELRAHMQTLQAANEKLSGQLDVKDMQIEALTNITRAAQTLDGLGRKQLSEPSEGDVLDIPEQAAGEQPLKEETNTKQENRRGLLARLFR